MELEKLLFSQKFQELIGEDALQAIKCGICWEFYTNPVILPCGHTFCYDCLLEMGRHAKMNRMHISFRELKITCPNCRFPILVHMLMNRNITFNYPLASFIEALRTTSQKSKVDVAIGTDSAVYDYDIKKLDKIKEDLDNIFASFRMNNNVVDDARQDINKIRREFNQCHEIDPYGSNFAYALENLKHKTRRIGECDDQQKLKSMSNPIGATHYSKEPRNAPPTLKDLPPPPGFQRLNGASHPPSDFHDPAILYRMSRIPGAPAVVPVQRTEDKEQLARLFQNVQRQ